MNPWIVALLVATFVGAKHSPKKSCPENFEVKFVPRQVLIERQFLRYDAELPGYKIASGIDAITISPKHPGTIPRAFVLQLQTGMLEHFELRSANRSVASNGNSLSSETIVTTSAGAQEVPRGTYFLVHEKNGVFTVTFTRQARSLLQEKCTFSWINAYRN